MNRSGVVIVLLWVLGFTIGWLLGPILKSTPSCHWQDLHTPAQTVDKAYYVTDPDGFSHTVTVQITRPAHVDKVCQ